MKQVISTKAMFGRMTERQPATSRPLGKLATTTDAVPALITNRYRLEERIGVGAMGVVWRAADVSQVSLSGMNAIQVDPARRSPERSLASSGPIFPWLRARSRAARRATTTHRA